MLRLLSSLLSVSAHIGPSIENVHFVQFLHRSACTHSHCLIVIVTVDHRCCDATIETQTLFRRPTPQLRAAAGMQHAHTLSHAHTLAHSHSHNISIHIYSLIDSIDSLSHNSLSGRSRPHARPPAPSLIFTHSSAATCRVDRRVVVSFLHPHFDSHSSIYTVNLFQAPASVTVVLSAT